MCIIQHPWRIQREINDRIMTPMLLLITIRYEMLFQSALESRHESA